MYIEDALLCMRIRTAGYEVMYLPIVPVVHYRGSSGKKAWYASILYSFQSSKIFVQQVSGRRLAQRMTLGCRHGLGRSSTPARRGRHEAGAFPQKGGILLRSDQVRAGGLERGGA